VKEYFISETKYLFFSYRTYSNSLTSPFHCYLKTFIMANNPFRHVIYLTDYTASRTVRVIFIFSVFKNQAHYRPGVPRGFQEVKVPRLRDNGP